MKSNWVLFCIVQLINLHLYQVGALTCLSKGPCGCKLDDDSGEIDLSVMMNQAPSPMFVGVDTQAGDISISVDLCRQFTCVQTNDAMICDVNIQQPKVIGNSLSSFDYDDKTKVVTFIYTQTGVPQPPTTRIIMHCTQDSGIGRLSNFEFQGSSLFTSTLSSQFACFKRIDNGAGSGAVGGLSNGTIMCIVLLVTVVVYILGGILVNKYVRKVEGSGLFPNHDFWSGFPGYVKVCILMIFFASIHSSNHTLVPVNPLCLRWMDLNFHLQNSEGKNMNQYKNNNS